MDFMNKRFRVSVKPYFISGTEVVKLNGYPGGYASDGLDVVEMTDDPLEKAILLKMSERGVNVELSVRKCAKIFNMQEDVVTKRLNHLAELGWLKDLGTSYRLLFKFDLK